MFKLIISTTVRDNAEKTFEWYEKQRKGLGYEFLTEIKNCFDKIRYNPENYRPVNNDKKRRRIKTERFPYLIYYRINGDDVIVARLFHAKRKKK